jgi:hypothetical protein
MTSEIVRARLEAMGPWAAEWYEERSAIKEYEGGVGRAVAESEAWREVRRGLDFSYSAAVQYYGKGKARWHRIEKTRLGERLRRRGGVVLVAGSRCL